ncbi:hypothetical protein GQ457_02G022210 [Hibiscus cannabinus]
MDEHSKVDIKGLNDETVVVDEAHKPLTAYFNFYLKKLSVLFKEMPRLKIDGVVSEIGFGALLGLKSRAIHREICRDLVQSFDVDSSTMEYNGHKIPIMVEDVEAVLGMKNEGVDVGKVIRKMNGKELALKYKINTKSTYHELHEEIVMESNDNSVEGKNVAKTNAFIDVIMDAFEKVFSHLNEMKVTLETGVDRQNKIEETLEILKDESKHVVDQVADPKAEDDTIGAVLVNDVIHLNDDQAIEVGRNKKDKVVMDAPSKVLSYVEITDGVGASARGTCDYIWNTPLVESKVIVNFGHMYLTVSDADTVRRGSWVNSMVIDAVGWTIIVEDIRSECKSRRGYLPCALIDQIVRGNLNARQIADYWRLSFKHYGNITEWNKIFIPINDSRSHWYLCALDMDHGHANVLDSLPTTRGNAARVAIVKKLLKKLRECFLDEKFVEIFGTPQTPFTELRVVVPKVKYQSNGYLI